jgi:hypothetical protein
MHPAGHFIQFFDDKCLKSCPVFCFVVQYFFRVFEREKDMAVYFFDKRYKF